MMPHAPSTTAEITQEPGPSGAVVACTFTPPEPDRRRWRQLQLAPALTQAPGARARLIEAIQRARGVDHPAVVAVLDLLEVDGRCCVEVDWIDGLDLAALLAAARASQAWPTPALVVQMGVAICEGLEHLHRQGMTHGALSPWRVRVHPHGQLLLDGLGLAAGLGQMSWRGVEEQAYLSPEQVRGLERTARADLYGCGLLLYELLTLQPAQQPGPDGDLLAVVARGAVAPLEQRRPDLAPGLRAAVMQALQPDPAARPASARALAEALLRASPAPGPHDTVLAYLGHVAPQHVARVTPIDRSQARAQAGERLRAGRAAGRVSLLRPALHAGAAGAALGAMPGREAATQAIDINALGLLSPDAAAPAAPARLFDDRGLSRAQLPDGVTRAGGIDIAALGLLDEPPSAASTRAIDAGAMGLLDDPSSAVSTRAIDAGAMGLLDEPSGVTRAGGIDIAAMGLLDEASSVTQAIDADAAGSRGAEASREAATQAIDLSAMGLYEDAAREAATPAEDAAREAATPAEDASREAATQAIDLSAMGLYEDAAREAATQAIDAAAMGLHDEPPTVDAPVLGADASSPDAAQDAAGGDAPAAPAGQAAARDAAPRPASPAPTPGAARDAAPRPAPQTPLDLPAPPDPMVAQAPGAAGASGADASPKAGAPGRRSRAPLIVALLLLAALIGVAVAWLLVSGAG